MKNYAEIFNGEVIAIGVCKDGHDLSCAPPLVRVICDASVQDGWTYDGNIFAAPAINVTQIAAQARAVIITKMNALDGGGQARHAREIMLANPPANAITIPGWAKLVALETTIHNLGLTLVPPRST
jgi:hypothetical protein